MERIEYIMDEDPYEEDVSPLQALGLHRVGAPPPPRPHTTPPSPAITLNKRGMPVRIRKKNPMYFDDTLVMTTPRATRGSPRKSGGNASNTPTKRHSRGPSPPHRGTGGRLSGTDEGGGGGGSTACLTSPRPQHSETGRGSMVTRASVGLGCVSLPTAVTPQLRSERTAATGRRHGDKQEQSIEVVEEVTAGHDLEPPNMMQLNLDCSSSSISGSSSSCSINSSSVTVSVPTPHPSSDPPAPESSLSPIGSRPSSAAVHYNGVRLRNFLKLPQAHKWIYYEWFYANIDQPLFLGRNDFEQVLHEAFPQLKTRLLTRRQWGLVRRIMGKPRRCSQAFFSEEIAALAKRRQVLRLLQQRKITDVSHLRDLPFVLPQHIPCQLVIGTKVTARIRKPENGLYMGRIDAVDTSNNTYRVTFVRSGIGTHSIPDYEVLSCDAPEMMPLASFQQKFRPRAAMGLVTPPRPLLPRPGSNTPGRGQSGGLGLSLDSPHSITNDPVLAQSPRVCSPSPSLGPADTIGQYPVQSLLHIVQLWKLLQSKAEKVRQLEALNCSAEKLYCTGERVTTAFQRRYATLVLDVDRLNEQLNAELLHVHTFCASISGSACAAAPRLLPTQITERCTAEAVAVVQVSNSSAPEPVTDSHALHLVTTLTALMLQIKNLGESEVSAFELTSLQASINGLREEVEDKASFRDLVDVPLTHIMAAASQLGPLSAFATHD